MSQLTDIFSQLYELSPNSLTSQEYNLDTISAFLKHLGNPEKKLKYIHVGGTSGKGSTVKYISRILEYQGLKVGEFYSPHIFSVRERIELNNQWISEQDFEKSFLLVREKMDTFEGERKPTFFETLFCMALLYFVSKKVDVAVIEVGLGGKLDATNVIDAVVNVVTNVGLDHTEVLGDTVEKIASDKVQIVKNGKILITGVRKKTVKGIFELHVTKFNASILYLSKDFGYINQEDGFFDYYDNKLEIKNINTLMPGIHQIENATIAIKAAVSFLHKEGKEVDKDKIKQAIAKATMPGRIQMVSRNPYVIWDAAHNVDKMQALVKTIKNVEKSFVFLLAFKRGQKIFDIADVIYSSGLKIDKIVLTKYKVKQDVSITSEDYMIYLDYFEKKFGKSKVSTQLDAKKAYKGLKRNLQQDQALVVTGSFYLLDTIARNID